MMKQEVRFGKSKYRRGTLRIKLMLGGGKLKARSVNLKCKASTQVLNMKIASSRSKRRKTVANQVRGE